MVYVMKIFEKKKSIFISLDRIVVFVVCVDSQLCLFKIFSNCAHFLPNPAHSSRPESIVT